VKKIKPSIIKEQLTSFRVIQIGPKSQNSTTNIMANRKVYDSKHSSKGLPSMKNYGL
jgi:hypothetical protein